MNYKIEIINRLCNKLMKYIKLAYLIYLVPVLSLAIFTFLYLKIVKKFFLFYLFIKKVDLAFWNYLGYPNNFRNIWIWISVILSNKYLDTRV